MKVDSLTKERSEETHLEWWPSVVLATPGWVALGGGIGSLQDMAGSLVNNIKYESFVTNWMPWIAVLFFVMGWVTAHSTEIVLLQRRIKTARVLVIFFFLSLMIVGWILFDLFGHSALNRLDTIFLTLVTSGYLFRYSMFHKKALIFLASALLGEKQNS